MVRDEDGRLSAGFPGFRAGCSRSRAGPGRSRPRKLSTSEAEDPIAARNPFSAAGDHGEAKRTARVTRPQQGRGASQGGSSAHLVLRLSRSSAGAPRSGARGASSPPAAVLRSSSPGLPDLRLDLSDDGGPSSRRIAADVPEDGLGLVLRGRRRRPGLRRPGTGDRSPGVPRRPAPAGTGGCRSSSMSRG